jgi:uncharacterized membrane protein YhaH (DUF805 family)
MNRLFTDGRWNAAHWIFVAFFVVLGFFLAIIGFADPTASRGMGALFLIIGLSWLALLSIAIVTLLRRTRDMDRAIKRFEAMSRDAEQPLHPARGRRDLAAE